MGPGDNTSVLVDLIYHTGLGMINLWNVFWNITLIILIISTKSMREDGQKMLVINIAMCFIVDALLGLFDQTVDVVPVVQEWFQQLGPCEGILIAKLVVKILIPYSIFLLCIDLCVQLKDPPFYAPSAGRSICMGLCDWLLSAALTSLLLFGVGRLERDEGHPECFTRLTLLYIITERCIVFFTPAFLLVIGTLFLIGLSCRTRTLTTLELHRGNPDIVVIQHARRVAPPVLVTCIFFLLIWAPYNSLYFMHVVLKPSMKDLLFYMNMCKHVAMATGAVMPLLWLTIDPDLRKSCCGCCEPRGREDMD